MRHFCFVPMKIIQVFMGFASNLAKSSRLAVLTTGHKNWWCFDYQQLPLSSCCYLYFRLKSLTCVANLEKFFLAEALCFHLDCFTPNVE